MSEQSKFSTTHVQLLRNRCCILYTKFNSFCWSFLLSILYLQLLSEQSWLLLWYRYCLAVLKQMQLMLQIFLFLSLVFLPPLLFLKCCLNKSNECLVLPPLSNCPKRNVEYCTICSSFLFWSVYYPLLYISIVVWRKQTSVSVSLYCLTA